MKLKLARVFLRLMSIILLLALSCGCNTAKNIDEKYLFIEDISILRDEGNHGILKLKIKGDYAESAWGIKKIEQETVGDVIVLTGALVYGGKGAFEHIIDVPSHVNTVKFNKRVLWTRFQSWMKKENITYKDKYVEYYLDGDLVKLHHDLYGYLVVNKNAIVENPGEIEPHYFLLSDRILVFSYPKPGDLRNLHIYLITLDGKNTEKFGPFTLDREYVFNPQKDKVFLDKNLLTVTRNRSRIVFDLVKQGTGFTVFSDL